MQTRSLQSFLLARSYMLSGTWRKYRAENLNMAFEGNEDMQLRRPARLQSPLTRTKRGRMH